MALLMNETRWIDKSTWGPGPWQDEPDRVEWRDEATGLPCIALRANPQSGNWCGYVGVSPTHPFHGKDYDDAPVDVHGGLTFAASCDDRGHGQERVCHVPTPGESPDVWWFGFDCHHYMDLAPGHMAYEREHVPDIMAKYAHLYEANVYRDLDYVKAECTSLAAQLKASAQ